MNSSCSSEKPAYLDPSLPFEDRVKDLIGRLTLEEKVGLMSHPANGISRLNIPAYNYWSEALHGVARASRGAEKRDASSRARNRAVHPACRCPARPSRPRRRDRKRRP